MPTRNARFTIAMATHEYPTSGGPVGGLGVYVQTIARELVRRGHEVHVVTCAHAHDLTVRQDHGVHLHPVALPAPDARDPASLIDYSAAVAARITELDQQHHFDVVEFQEWAGEGWAYHPRRDQLLAVRIQAPSFFVRRHEYAANTPAEGQVDEIERWPLERADLVTAPSRYVTRIVADRWCIDVDPTVILPNGIDPLQFAQASRREPNAAPLVLSVNRLTPIKGPDVFVRAAAEVHRRFPDARFRLVGRAGEIEGQPAEVWLRRLARELGLPADRLEIAGAAERDRLPAEFAAADICVNPSRDESYSYTSAEALATGRACVLSDGMGITEHLANGEDCLIVPAGDAMALAAAIERLLADADLRQRLGAAARRAAETKLSAAAAADTVLAAYSAGIERVKARPAIPEASVNLAILTWNGLADTQRCLESVRRNTPIPYQIFIVDNGSTDGTVEWLRSQADPRLHVVESPVNLGVGGGRTRLIREMLPHLAPGSFAVFVDNDMELLAGWHEPFLAVFEAHPEAGIASAVGHRIIVREDARDLLPAPSGEPAPVDVASGGFCCWVRTETLRQVGVFDRRLGKFWHEDDDYSVRAIHRGFEVWAVPEAKVVHHEHGTGVALPALEAGGSPTNQAYLCEKWRALGLIDASGNVIHPATSDLLPIRVALGERLGRGVPLQPDELRQASEDLAAMVQSPDVAQYLVRHADRLTPTFMALLEVLEAEAAADGDDHIRDAYRELRDAADGYRPSRLIRPLLCLPARATPTTRNIGWSKLCDANDWDRPAWQTIAGSVFRDLEGRDYYRRHRKIWEYTQAYRALDEAGALRPDASGIVVNAGTETMVFALARRVRSLVLIDRYGSTPRAPATMLTAPERHAPFPYPRERLTARAFADGVVDAPDGSFDFAVSCALHETGTHEEAAGLVRELGRVVKPGGVVVLVTEVVLNGAPHGSFFRPEELLAAIAGSGLEPTEPLDFAVSDATLDGLVDLGRDPNKRPHLVVMLGQAVLTSGVFVLTCAGSRAAADRAAEPVSSVR